MLMQSAACADKGFSHSAAVPKKPKSRKAIVRSADQNLSAFCCPYVWHYRQPCPNRKSSCRFLLHQAALFMSTITCVSEAREQNESSLFMVSCSRTTASEIGRP